MGMSAKAIQKQRPALRLVSTKGLSRDEWLKVRKQGIGSSDAAAAVGMNPYQSQLELWMVKTGREAGLPKPDSDDPTSPVYWGHILEPIVAEQYSQQTGRKVRRVNAVLQHSDPDKHWMLANLDYSVVADEEVQILECKTAGEFGSRRWKEGVPDYIQCQVQHQLAVTGKQAADVCVLLCGQDLKIYRLERNEELIEALYVLERQFWDFVETDTPPPADGTDSAERALRYLYPVDIGETLDFSQSKDLSHHLSDSGEGLRVGFAPPGRGSQKECAERKAEDHSGPHVVQRSGPKPAGRIHHVRPQKRAAYVCRKWRYM